MENNRMEEEIGLTPDTDATRNSAPASYPPCTYITTVEKETYCKLRTIFEQHSHTWDSESTVAWFHVMPKAKVSPTNFHAVTTHRIAKSMYHSPATWAHFVVLHVIYEQKLFNSRKVMTILRDKYPQADFSSYAFSPCYLSASLATAKETITTNNPDAVTPNEFSLSDDKKRVQIGVCSKVEPSPQMTQAHGAGLADLPSSGLTIASANQGKTSSQNVPINSIEKIDEEKYEMTEDLADNEDRQQSILHSSRRRRCSRSEGDFVRKKRTKTMSTLSCTHIEETFRNFNSRINHAREENIALKQRVADLEHESSQLKDQSRAERVNTEHILHIRRDMNRVEEKFCVLQERFDDFLG